ncbi:MAG: pyridoxamine 5'-phosphate oxidase family protein [Verrucomicrobiales bacterium]|nr:pyridoxamine 5'-phosphate oxidase family protein [Verrucomicrobiales bacterium]
MADRFMRTVLTPSVLAAQKHYFGRQYPLEAAPARDLLTEGEIEFITTRDSFYLGTVTESGWPYIQHRGGEPGFLRVLGPGRIGFADYKGNRQMISTGNLGADDRVSLFLMDYRRRQRLKILGHARVLDARENTDLVGQLAEPKVHGIVERLFLIEVLSFDWNCPKYITPRFTLAEVEEVVAPLRQRITDLEAQLAARS